MGAKLFLPENVSADNKSFSEVAVRLSGKIQNWNLHRQYTPHVVVRQVKRFGISTGFASHLSVQGQDLTYVAAGPIGANPVRNWSAGWLHWFAQMLATQALIEGHSTTIRIEEDQAITNGYFGCTGGNGGATYAGGPTQKKGYLYYVYRQTAVALSGACTSVMPGGWGAGIH